MILNKWNYETKEYEPYEVPDSWTCKTGCESLCEAVNCPHCGKAINFGDGYTSREIHDEHGFGYAICSNCWEKEYENERAKL